MSVIKCPSCGSPVHYSEKSSSGKAVGCIIAAAIGFFVLMVVGLLTAIAIPAFLSYRIDARETMCETNLRSIYTAKGSYQAVKGLPDGADVKREDYADYMEDQDPSCPSGGVYTDNPLGVNPVCSDEKHHLAM